jgi:hypothetical protein
MLLCSIEVQAGERKRQLVGDGRLNSPNLETFHVGRRSAFGDRKLKIIRAPGGGIKNGNNFCFEVLGCD